MLQKISEVSSAFPGVLSSLMDIPKVFHWDSEVYKGFSRDY